MACSKRAKLNSTEELGRSVESMEKQEKIDRVRKLAGKAVCQIQTVDNGQAHGALYQVIDNNRRDRYLIMTSHHSSRTSNILT